MKLITQPVARLNGRTSFIDHFIISNNLKDRLRKFSSIDPPENSSDHVSIICSLDFNVAYSKPEKIQQQTGGPDWQSAIVSYIEYYKNCVDYHLLNIPLPLNIISCNDLMCKNHIDNITVFHDSIAEALAKACDDSIPSKKSGGNSKVVVGWNDHVEHYFKTSLFWHTQWVEKGRPQEGLLFDIRRTTRAHYHKARKFAIKNKNILQSEKLAESLMNDSNTVFWQNVKKCRLKKQTLPSVVDDAHNPQSIADSFESKFEQI